LVSVTGNFTLDENNSTLVTFSVRGTDNVGVDFVSFELYAGQGLVDPINLPLNSGNATDGIYSASVTCKQPGYYYIRKLIVKDNQGNLGKYQIYGSPFQILPSNHSKKYR
jgi:hypothetical protein